MRAFILFLALAPSKAPRVAIAADAGVRALDVYSTGLMLQRGNREMFLPDAVARHAPAMAAFSTGMVVLNVYAARRVGRHHRRWASLFYVAEIAGTGYFAAHNLTLPNNQEPKIAIQKPVLVPH